MSKTRNFKELQAKTPLKAHAEAVPEGKQLLAKMRLQQLREGRKLTQESLSKALGARQDAADDMHVSTLAGFIEAMGRKLEIRAVFPEGITVVDRFEDKR